MNTFSPPSSVRNTIGSPSSAASPPIRLAPTTLIGVSWSRSWPPIASISLGILDGKLPMAWKVCLIVSPTYQIDAGTAPTTP